VCSPFSFLFATESLEEYYSVLFKQLLLLLDTLDPIVLLWMEGSLIVVVQSVVCC
jgi:hypothetical protein